MNKIEKIDFCWDFDGEKIVMHCFGVRRDDDSAMLIVKHPNEEALCAGVFDGVVFNGMSFSAGYKEPGKHGWELRVKTNDFDLRVDASRSLPPEAPEILFFNTGVSGTEVFALIHGNGFGDIHRFRFPARCGFQWLSVLQFYLSYFGLNIGALDGKKNEKKDGSDNG